MPISYIPGTSFWATSQLWVIWHLRYSVSSMLLFLEMVSLSLSCSQALLLVITFKKIRYSLNKREKCSFDGCWYNITLFIKQTACNFFQGAWQRHELWRKKKTWLQGEMMIPTAEFVILFCLCLFSEPCKILIFSAEVCHRSFILFLLREWE